MRFHRGWRRSGRDRAVLDGPAATQPVADRAGSDHGPLHERARVSRPGPARSEADGHAARRAALVFYGAPLAPPLASAKESPPMIHATPNHPPEAVLPFFSLVGKKVFVTGASRGIGRACALVLASAGADVALGSSAAGADSAGDVSREIRSLGRRAETYAFDVGVCRDV